MTTPSPPRSRDRFKIAIICALPLEADAVHAVFDVDWEDEGMKYGKARGDSNTYSTGAIAGHPVVLAHMPTLGLSNASATAALLRSSFPQIQLSLVVGICGVAPVHPVTREEIVLGDIIISTAVIQTDFGRLYPGGFRRKTEIEDSLGRSTPEIRSFVSKLQTRQVQMRMMKNMASSLHSNGFASYPGAHHDHLYEASYLHQHKEDTRCEQCSLGSGTCPMSCDELQCEAEFLIPRQRHASYQNSYDLLDYTPSIHFGRYGSASSVIKSGQDRDRIAFEDKVVGFEMEGAGVWDHGPTIVIKGACDYADSHKNKRWQTYAAASGAACLKAFLTEWTGVDESSTTGTKICSVTAGIVLIFHFLTCADEPSPVVSPIDRQSKTVWHVPFDQLSGFIGREDEVKRLQEKLFEVSSRRVVAILGLGGMGKSRLALEIAFQTRKDQPDCAILWIDASDRLTFEKDVLAIAKKLGIPGATDEQADFKQLFKQGLSSSSLGKWLLVIDNADDEALWGKPADLDPDTSMLGQYLPNTSNGSILITTRTRRVAVTLAGRDILNLAEPSAESASKMFMGMLEDEALAGDALTTSRLLEKLTLLPLAITQAASFINMTQISAKSYLNLVNQPKEEEVIKLLSKDFGDPSRCSSAKNPVATTWFISFKHIRTNHPLAADILSSMACFHEKNIPQSLLPPLSRTMSDVDTHEAIGVLIGYSFVRRHTSTTTFELVYDLHRLVQLAARNWLSMDDSLTRWKRLCIEQTNQVFPAVLDENKEIWTMYLPHAQRLCDDSELATTPARYHLLQFVADCFLEMGKYAEAVRIQKLVVQHFETSNGDVDRDRPLSLAYGHLGRALRFNGDDVGAQYYLEKGLSIAKEVFSPDDVDVLVIQEMLASIYRGQGLLKEAEEQMVKLMHTSTRALGLEHFRTLGIMDGLAKIYEDQDRVQEAELLMHKTVLLASKALGELHGLTLGYKRRLASLFYRQNRLKEAEELKIYVWKTQTKLLGPDHPSTLWNMGELALVYAAQNRLEDAEAMETQLLKKLTLGLGPQHPGTLTCMINLACTLNKQGKIVEAIQLMSQCVQISVRLFGAEHRDTQRSASTLAIWRCHRDIATHSQHNPGASQEQETQDYTAQVTHITPQAASTTMRVNDSEQPNALLAAAPAALADRRHRKRARRSRARSANELLRL
ncbi:hypothetical protein LTR84_001512 [Exophiala bonariae]|uniref:Nucleoside phosphorylase domain-containing protein n=1 Tax=Exophiala bonariae TaxID=1690606 RepID=A0AAV9NCW5_9EURO|nr:hypothetical protein LTR84_001512 [Exophiala bonariae]